MTLKKHVTRWSDCDRCPIHCFTQDKVFYRGPSRCEILFSGEAPGDTELVLVKPFVGPSGKLLTHLIESAAQRNDLPKAQVGFTNAIVCAPYNEETLSLRPPSNTEIANCSDRLLECIQLVRPKVIVALGNTAKKAIDKLGTRLVTPVLYGVHPAAIIRQGERGSLDLARLEETLDEAFQQLKESL